MENEQRAATGWNVESYRLRISRIIQNMDQEAILENAVTVERCVRDVINRPRYVFDQKGQCVKRPRYSQRDPAFIRRQYAK